MRDEWIQALKGESWKVGAMEIGMINNEVN